MGLTLRVFAYVCSMQCIIHEDLYDKRPHGRASSIAPLCLRPRGARGKVILVFKGNVGVGITGNVIAILSRKLLELESSPLVIARLWYKSSNSKLIQLAAGEVPALTLEKKKRRDCT